MTLDIQECYAWMLQLRVHTMIVREIRAQGLNSVEDVWKTLSNVTKSRIIIVLECDTQVLELV